MATHRCPPSNPRNLGICSFIWQMGLCRWDSVKDLGIQLRILDHLGGPNGITRVSICEMVAGESDSEGKGMMEAKSKWCDVNKTLGAISALKMEGGQLGANEWGRPQGPGKKAGKLILPSSLQKRMQPCHRLQNCRIINVYCLKPLGGWLCVTTTIGNEYKLLILWNRLRHKTQRREKRSMWSPALERLTSSKCPSYLTREEIKLI